MVKYEITKMRQELRCLGKRKRDGAYVWENVRNLIGKEKELDGEV